MRYFPDPVGHSTFKLDQRVLTIEQFTTTGGDLSLTAQGTIELTPDPSESALAIQFTLAPAANAAANLSGLFAMLPHPPGPVPYHLTGTLSTPQIN